MAALEFDIARPSHGDGRLADPGQCRHEASAVYEPSGGERLGCLVRLRRPGATWEADDELRQAVALDEYFRAEFPDKRVSKFADLYPGQEHKLTVALHIRHAYRDRNRRPAREPTETPMADKARAVTAQRPAAERRR